MKGCFTAARIVRSVCVRSTLSTHCNQNFSTSLTTHLSRSPASAAAMQTHQHQNNNTCQSSHLPSSSELRLLEDLHRVHKVCLFVSNLKSPQRRPDEVIMRQDKSRTSDLHDFPEPSAAEHSEKLEVFKGRLRSVLFLLLLLEYVLKVARRLQLSHQILRGRGGRGRE